MVVKSLSDIVFPSPFFSIIVTAYNQEKCIHQAITSVLDQAYRDFELIIVNDGSIDSTADILEKYANLNEKISIVTHLKNESLHIARLDGVLAATGQYVVFLDGDDYFRQDAFQILYKTIQENPGYDFYEYGYITQPVGDIVFPFDLREDRFFALFDDKNICPHIMWNKVYSLSLLKKAFINARKIYLNFYEDVYESILIAYYANQRFQIKEVIINYNTENGMTHLRKNIDEIVEQFKYIKITVDCINYFFKKEEIKNLSIITCLEKKLFNYVYATYFYSDVKYKLHLLLPDYFSWEIIRTHFLKLEGELLKNINAPTLRFVIKIVYHYFRSKIKVIFMHLL